MIRWIGLPQYMRPVKSPCLTHPSCSAHTFRIQPPTMTGKPKIGILVVAYNAETTLRSVLQRIPQAIWDKIEEVFIFDDASKDRTYETGKACMAEPFGHKLRVYRNDVNLMYGGNQRRGYQYAIERGLDIVVLLHGDGQYA